MSEKQEMIADIITEMRDIGKLDEKSNDKIPRSLMGLGLRTLADRLEAAAKREKAEIEASALSVGGIVEASRQCNAAAMREALEMMISLFDKGVICTSYANTPEEMEQIEELYRKAKSALSLPLRNCDVGTAEEQDARFVTWRYSKPIRTELGLDALEWAQMPYEEGVKK